MEVDWWVTTPVPEYKWTEPTAWTSERLYTWGAAAGDTDRLLAATTTGSDFDSWMKYYMCKKIRLNGKAGAAFFNRRYQNVYVGSPDISSQGL